jgi:hypothetical protein
MGAIASLDSQQVTVTPGAEASLKVKVRNNGSVVDQFALSVVGDASGWARAEPAELSLFPGAEDTATIIFSPPRDSTVAAGSLPFGVRVASQEDPDGSVVEEGKLEIEPFIEVAAELQPLTSRGSRGVRHDLAVDNRGNTPLNANIVGVDSNEDVRFDIKPRSVVVEPGQAVFAEVGVKPAKRMWRGQSKSRAFSVQVEAPDHPPAAVSGAFQQEPVIPGWLIKGLIGLALLLILLLLIWFLLLRPTFLDAAEDRATEAGEAAGKAAAEEAIAEVLPSQAPGGGTESPSPSVSVQPTAPPSSSSSPSPTLEPTPATLLPEGDPVTGRLEADDRPATALRVPADKTWYLTDLVFSNPAEENGDVELRRGDEALLALKLEHFRDLDFHFVTPIVFEAGERLDVWCPSCSDAALFYNGYER